MTTKVSINDNSRRISFGWGQMNACCISVPIQKDYSYEMFGNFGENQLASLQLERARMIVARLSARTKVGDFKDDFFMGVLGFKD